MTLKGSKQAGFTGLKGGIVRKVAVGQNPLLYRAGTCFPETKTGIAIGLILIFVEILAGNIVLGHFVGVNFTLVGIFGGLHARYDVCLEGVPFLEQFFDTF